MLVRTIDFRSIRPHNGSQYGGFEELCCQLAFLDTPTGRPFYRKGVGADAGVECYRIEPDSTETAWQAKYFFEFSSSAASQLKESFENALAGHPALTTYIVCMPRDLSDGRVGRSKSERQRWDDWVDDRLAAVAPRQVKITLWGAFEITERLGRNDPLHAGRRAYWFDSINFGQDWFRSRFDRARSTLGARYTPELNIELPIWHVFAAVARDPLYIQIFEDWADHIDEAVHSGWKPIREVLSEELISDFDSLVAAIIDTTRSIRTVTKGPADSLPISDWQDRIKNFGDALTTYTEHIWNKCREEGRNSDQLRRAKHYAWQMHDTLRDIDDEFHSPAIRLANSSRLLVTGDAGVGKSHLLADVARRHIEQGFPAVLVLGGWFSDSDPWAQIADQLGLTTIPPDEILGALDAAAEAAGTRALFMVDAINERQGIAVWAERLAAFLEAAKPFPRVAVVVSCRTTFVPYIIADSLNEAVLPRIVHPGFAGRAAEAARRYLDQRGIVRMAAPHLAPEFENPLFLKICCDLLEKRGEREFPRGLSGVTSIYGFYFAAIADKLTKSMGLDGRYKIVERAIQALTDRMVEVGAGYLPINEVLRLFEEIHPSNGRQEQSVFFQFESEGIIAVEPVMENGAIVEQVRFTFERISDHRIAERLLDQHVTPDDPAAAFAENGPLHHYVAGKESYRFAGIVEALSIQLPERIGIELLDVVNEPRSRWSLVEPFRLSLLWREQKAFTGRTLKLVEELFHNDGVLSTLLAIASEPANNFNADYLDRILRKFSMPDRDVHWSVVVTRIAEREGNPVQTLIEWTLANGLEPIEEDRARLTATVLAWLLSLSHRAVRDKATKALATLLLNRRALAATLIRCFAEIDDPYVIDRVLAAAYGAAMRNHSNEGLADLASAAFETIFARNPVPVHALIRDHARGIVEFAASRGVLPEDVNIGKARPPYGPGLPLEPISDEVIESFIQDFGRGSFHDDIYSSAISDGDFARYVIDTNASKFLQLPIADAGRTQEDIYNEWWSQAIMPYQERVAALERVLDVVHRLQEIPDVWQLWERDTPESNKIGQRRKDTEAELDNAVTELEELLGIERREFAIRARSYILGQESYYFQPSYEGEITRRWVGWRAHNLGWTAERFGDFDGSTHSSSRMEHRIERIGKKYQWIALHELIGRLADTSAMVPEWQGLPRRYEGPWQMSGIREMDPSLLVTSTRYLFNDDQSATWWSPHSVTWRRDSAAARYSWMADEKRDVPNPVEQIDVTDPNGRAWLVLDIKASRNQRVLVDGERVIHRMSWHKINCLLVGQSDAPSLIRHLSTSEPDHTRSEIEPPYDAFLGEYFWHPSCGEVYDSFDVGAGRHTVRVYSTAFDKYFERAGYDHSFDKSFYIKIPTPVFVEKMGLRLFDGYSLNYSFGNGRLIWKDPSVKEPGFGAAVISRHEFIEFLDKENLQAIWIFSGEKSAHGGTRFKGNWGGDHQYWGIFSIRDGRVSGELKFKRREPNGFQLKEFFEGD